MFPFLGIFHAWMEMIATNQSCSLELYVTYLKYGIQENYVSMTSLAPHQAIENEPIKLFIVPLLNQSLHRSLIDRPYHFYQSEEGVPTVTQVFSCNRGWLSTDTFTFQANLTGLPIHD